MKEKAFSLIELVLATVLGVLIMLGSVGVLENMQRESAKIQSRINDDMNWVEANHHLAQMIRSSSYLDIPQAAGTPDPNILILYNYNGAETGRYINNPDSHNIGYYVDGGNTLQRTFNNVNAVFSAPSPASPGKGWKYGRLIEANINYAVNYTTPSTPAFISSISLSCRTATPPPITWAITLGGIYEDDAWSVQQTTDRGYIVAGYTSSSASKNSRDIYLVKLRPDGTKQWDKKIGGGSEDLAYSVQQIPDGYIVAGYTKSLPSTSGDMYLVKTDPNGDLPAGNLNYWQRRFDGGLLPQDVDVAWSAQQTTDRGYIVAGYTTKAAFFTNLWVIKTNSNGEYLAGDPDCWQLERGVKTPLPPSSLYIAYSVQQTTDGGYIVAGQNMEYAVNGGLGGYDFYLIKINSTGVEAWHKMFGGDRNEYARSVQQTADGGYIIAGLTSSSPTNINGDMYLVKTNPTGDEVWNKRFGSSFHDDAYSVQQTRDGGYIIAGYAATSALDPGYRNARLIKIFSNGTPDWPPQTFGGSGYNDYAHSVQQTRDGGYIIAGYTESFGAGGKDMYIIKTDSDGNCPEASSPTPG